MMGCPYLDPKVDQCYLACADARAHGEYRACAGSEYDLYRGRRKKRMYRLEVFSPWRGWYVHAMGEKTALEEFAYGRFTRWRIRPARKMDQEAFSAGYYAPAEENEDVLLPALGYCAPGGK